MTRTYALSSAALITMLLAGTGAAILMADNGPQSFADCREGVVAGGQAAIGGPFTLTTHQGTTVTEAEVIDRPALVYFGYTHCPDICPLDAVRNAEAVDLLESLGHEVRPVFITVDPGRDTPEVMARFVENMHEDMWGLTGSEEQVAAAADAYRVYYQLHDRGDDPYYLVDHTGFTYLMLPETGFAEFFQSSATPQDMAERTACFLQASQG